MAFSSLVFLYGFLPLTLVLYRVCPASRRQGLLLVISLAFYLWNGLLSFAVLLSVILYTYLLGLLCGRLKAGQARIVFFAGVSLLLLLLGFFKYGGALSARLGGRMTLALPIGLSFYLFRAYSYLFDVYCGGYPAETHPVRLALYLSRFTEVLSGPIVLYRDENAVTCAVAEPLQIAGGLVRFLLGLAKKVLLAASFFETWRYAYTAAAEERSVLTALLGLSAYAFRIYFDFSGYSDMAIGIGQCLGITLPENFRYPYTATSVTDFWRRWHVSLSHFFRTYVYIPLGGNRRGRARTCLNLLIVFCMTGLWHGSEVNFLLWGLYHALLLVLEKTLLRTALCRLPSALRRAYTISAVFLGWLIFAFDQSGVGLSYKDGIAYLRSLLPWRSPWLIPADLYELRCTVLLFFVGILASTPYPRRLAQGFLRRFPRASVLLMAVILPLLLLVSTAYLLGMGYQPFLYFKF